MSYTEACGKCNKLKSVFWDKAVTIAYSEDQWCKCPKSGSRDTQFQGFAKALWDELVRANGYGYIDVNEDDDGIDPTNYREVIARWAYDFACHLIKNGDPIDLDTSGEYGPMTDEEAQRRVNNFPDLTELPKEQEPELITLGRFIAMLDERGLSSHQYTEPRYSSSFGNYTAHMIDIGKDGKVLATYDTGAIIGTVFTEKHMAQELDGLLDK